MTTQAFPRTRHGVQPRKLDTFLAGIVLAIAAFLRLWQIGTKPGWEWDESSYTAIGGNVANHGTVQSVAEYGHSPATFLFHPPFYFLELGGWFKLVGIGVTQARVLSAIMSLVALTILYVLAKNTIGHKPALVLFAFLAIDPWMVYANRTSWMENSLIVLICIAILLYWRAIQRSTVSAFVIAGASIGAAIVFKHTAAYLLLVAGVYCVVNRESVKKHLALAAGTLAVVCAYLIGMSIAYGSDFWATNQHQLLRTVGSFSVNKSGNGSIHGLRGLIEPLTGQYRVFAATLIVMAIAGLWWMFRITQALTTRSLHHIRSNALAFAWVTGGIIGFAAVQLKFPSYFQIILIALYFYLATEVTALVRSHGRIALRRTAIVSMILVALLSTAGFQWRILGHNDNAIAAVGQFAEESIPKDAVVLTEQPIGNLIGQRFCDIRAHAHACADVATHVITYQSINYPGPDNEDVRRILAKSTKIWSKTGFKETLTVYRVNR